MDNIKLSATISTGSVLNSALAIGPAINSSVGEMSEEERAKLDSAYKHSQEEHVQYSDIEETVQTYVQYNKELLKGDQGEPGIQGPKGDQGEDGLTAAIKVNGSTYTHSNGVITLPDIPTRTSQLTNDSQFITSIPSEYINETELQIHTNEVLSAGEQLVLNGNQILQNNYNFSKMIYDGSQSNNSGGSLLSNTGKIQEIVTDYYFPINANKPLYASFDIKSELKSQAYGFVQFSDVDKNGISAEHHMYQENTLTKLTQDLKNGDTVVHLEDLTNWRDDLTAGHQKSFIFWNYTNKKGYTYPPETYSRNSYMNLYAGSSSVDKTNNTITLSTAWNRGNIPAGTFLSQGASGSTYKYIGANIVLTTTEWKTVAGSYDGVDYTGKNDPYKLPPGTAFGRFGMYLNFNSIPNEKVWVTNIVVKEDIYSAIEKKADKSTLTAHTSDTTSHITATERNTWNSKSNLALGTTSTTAYRGDYGNTAYTHSQTAHAPSNAQKNSDITKSEIEAKLIGDITTHSHSIYALASDVKTKDNFVINISSIFAPSPQLSANGLAIIVNSLDEMTDVSKKYVFNGYVYECVVTEIVTSYTNVLKTAKDIDGTIYNGKGYKDNTRLNSSGEVKDASGMDIDTSGKITCKVGDRLRIKSVKSSKNYTTYIYSYNDSNVKQGVYTIDSALATTTTKDIDMTLDSATFGANFTNIRFCSGDINDNTIVTINEPIEESTETTYEWVNTGEKYEYGDFDAKTCTAQDIYDYLEVLCSKYPNYITKETLGKDESGIFDCNRYVLSKHFYQAWQKVNYPKMYSFVNGSTVIYATSVSPRIGDTLYTTKYIGTAYAKVTAVDTPNKTRTINGKLFTRDESKDVEPTLVYTSILADSVSPNGIVYNESKSGIAMISSISDTSMSDNKGVSYTRYPLGDRNRNMEKPIVVTIGANEHGPQGDPKEPAIICARFIKDLCECKNSDNELLNHLKNNIMVVIMPIINPYGFTNGDDLSANRYGYYNYNQVNINRNYDCIGFGKETNAGDCGDYGGSENETQYFMNTLAEPKSVVGISIHCLGYTTGGNDGLCHYQGNGFNADKMNEIAENMKANYNLKFTSYGEAPQETTAKSPTYISKIGAKGGIIEFQAREGYMADSTASLHTSRIMEANYTLLLECIYAFLTD